MIYDKARGFASSIELSYLNGTPGFRLGGEATDDLSGVAVNAAEDVNVEGFDDIIVGARLGNPDSLGNAGKSYVVFGKASGFASSILSPTHNGTTGLRLDGAAPEDRTGPSASVAGDVNVVGFVEFIVGARIANPHPPG